MVRIRFKFPPQVANDKAEILGLAGFLFLPGALREIAGREGKVGVSGQEAQNEKLFGGKAGDAAAGASDLVGGQVDGAIFQDDFRSRLIRARYAAQESAHAGEEFPVNERGGKIVIGAGVPGVDAGLRGVVASQDDNSEIRLLPNSAAQRVRIGGAFQARGEKQQMMRSTGCLLDGLLGGLGFSDLMTFELRDDAQFLAQLGVAASDQVRPDFPVDREAEGLHARAEAAVSFRMLLLGQRQKSKR